MYMYTANQALFARVYMISIATGFFRGQESKDRSQLHIQVQQLQILNK